jgi:uncharacterized protein (TIGR03083 family)
MEQIEKAMHSTIETIDSERVRLAAFFRTLGEDDWKKETYCPDWNASQIVGHLTLGAQFYASTVGNGLEGNHGFPLGASDREEFMALRTSIMDEIAALDGDALVDRFDEDTRKVIALFRSLGPEDYEKTAWHRRGILPIPYFVIQRTYEFSLHEWDILNEPGAPLHPAALDQAADNLRLRIPMIYNTNPDLKLEGRFRFETTDTGHVWAMSIENEKASALSEAEGEFDVSLFAPASDMILMATGRADIDAKEATGAFRIEGETAKARALIPAIFFPN